MTEKEEEEERDYSVKDFPSKIINLLDNFTSDARILQMTLRNEKLLPLVRENIFLKYKGRRICYVILSYKGESLP